MKKTYDNFDTGAMVALGIMNQLYNEPTMAFTVLEEMGLHKEDYRHLDQYDIDNLDKIFRNK